MNGIKFVSAVIVAAALCVSTAKVNAMTVNWSTGGNAIALSDGTTGVPQNDAVYLGTFKNNMSNGAITALFTGNSNAATDILAQFNIWNQDAIGDQVDPGVVGAFAAVNNANPGAIYFTSNAFLIVLNSAGSAGATQIGVYKGPTPLWSFPADDTTPKGMSVDAIDGTMVVIGGYTIGGYGDAEANGATGWFGDSQNAALLANIVPEPSTYMLVAMGLLGAWGLRRRRS